MQRYIAFLRAINVGGHNVKMDTLRRLFEDLGLANVATFIASGNVIFDAPDGDPAALEQRIEAHLQANLGYAVATMLRTPAELAAILDNLPFPPEEVEAEGNYVSVDFLKTVPGPEALHRLAALQSPDDELILHGRELYWLARPRNVELKISGGVLEKALGVPATMRNITTVRKLATKYPAASG